jgi:hypothetical protein
MGEKTAAIDLVWTRIESGCMQYTRFVMIAVRDGGGCSEGGVAGSAGSCTTTVVGVWRSFRSTVFGGSWRRVGPNPLLSWGWEHATSGRHQPVASSLEWSCGHGDGVNGASETYTTLMWMGRHGGAVHWGVLTFRRTV